MVVNLIAALFVVLAIVALSLTFIGYLQGPAE